MHRFSKIFNRPISHRAVGTLFFVAAATFAGSTAWAQSQTKSITPDPYYPAGSSSAWKAPVNLGIGSGSGSRSTLQAPSKLSGFGLSPVDQTAGSAIDKPVAKSASAIGTQVGSVGSTTRPRSLIVQANETPAAGASQGAAVQRVDHQEAPVTKSFQPGKVLALVGGEPIFVGDLMFQINQIIEEKMAGAPEKIKEQQRQMAIPQLLPQFVESKLLYQGAVRGLPDEVDLDGIFEQVEKQFEKAALPSMMEGAGVKTIVEFDARLRGQDYSLRQLKRNWAIQQFTRHSIGQAIGNVPETTHQEMLDRYQEKLASYEKPARAKWEQILVRFDRTGSHAEAKRMIVEIGNQIVHGANFAATAKKRSHGFNAASGGVRDWTTQGALALEEIDKALFSLPVGELSDLIQTERGFHIVRVTKRDEASRTSFLDAQGDIKKQIEGEKRKAAFGKYVKKLREEIPVEYLTNE